MEKENIIFTELALKCNIETIRILESSSYRKSHFHEEAELVYAEKGDILCYISGEKVILNEGSILLIGNQVIHSLNYLHAPAEITYIQMNITDICDSVFPDFFLLSCFCCETLGKYSNCNFFCETVD